MEAISQKKNSAKSRVPAAPVLQITDQRMLGLPAILKMHGLIKSTQNFCDAMEMPKQTIRNIRIGKQHFTAEQIRRICLTYGINANYITGQEEEVYRKVPLSKRR